MSSIEERFERLNNRLQKGQQNDDSIIERFNRLNEKLSQNPNEPIRRSYTPASNHVAENGGSTRNATSIVPVIERQEAYKPSNLLDMTDDELSVREDALQQLVNSNRFRSQELNLGTDAAARQAEENLKALQEARGLKRLGAYSDEELRGMSLADIDETVRQLNEQLKYAKDNQMDAQALEYQSQIDALQGARGQRLQGKAQSYDDFTAEELQERLANLERQQNALYQKSTSTGDGRYYQDATRMGYQKEELQQANYLAKVRETDEDTMQMTLNAIRKQMELADLMQQEGTYRDVNPWFAVNFGTPSEEQGSAYENIKALSAEADAALQAAKAKAHNTGADWTTLEHYAESQINKERADAMTENAKNTVEDADSIVGAMLRHSGSQIFGGLGALDMTAQAIGNTFRGSEDYLPIDPNTNYNRYSILADAYQQGGAELVEKYAAADPILSKFLTGKDYITGDQSRAQYLYNVGVSSLDSAVNLGVAMMLSAGISGFFPMDAQTFNTTSARLVNAIMGSSAATSAIRENLKSGDMTDAQAVTLGIMSGVAEAMTESWSIETLLNGDTTAFARLINRMVKNPVANNLLKGFISEGSEEIASNWLNRLFDYIVRHDKSETMQDYNAYLAQGDSSGEAWRKIFAGWLQEDASAGLAGSLAGLTGGASHYALTGTVDSVDTYVTEREAEKARLQAEQNARQEAQTQQTTAQNAQQEQQKAAAQPTAQNVQQNTAEQQTAENTQQERPAARQVYDKQQLQKSADTLGDHGSKALMTAYDSEASANVSAGDFYRGFLEYYQAGVNNVRMEKVSGEFADRLNSAQKYAAYVSGQNDAQQTLEREQRAKNFAQVAGTDKGLVYDDYVNEMLASGKEERLTMDDVNTLAKDLGLRVRFVDSIRGGDANATIFGAEVLIEKNNPNPVMFLAGHEFTHRLQELAPDEYRAFRKIVAESRNDYIQARIDNYAAHDIQLDYQDALDEEAADYGGRLLLDGEVLDDFINKHHTERNLLEKILDAIRAFIDKVTGAAKKQAQTAEGKLLKALEAATEQAKKLEQNKNAAARKTAEQANTLQGIPGGHSKGNQVRESNLQGAGGKVKYSLKEYSGDEKKQHVKDAVSFFGKTYKWAETGYITTDGSRLDFSGKHEGGPGGYRTVDHRDIRDALGDDYGGDDYSGGMVQFMSEGNIRIMPESGGINLSVMPTKAQMETLSGFISSQRGEVILDLDTPDGQTVFSTEYPRGTHANKVLSDIRGYFEDGTKPYVSDLARFRYSLKQVENVNIEYDAESESAYPGKFSMKTWNESEYAKDKAAAAHALSESLNVSLQAAQKYIDNVNSVAKMIADDRVRLDYESSPGQSSFVSNTEYGGSIDFSTICKKRRLVTGTFEAIQNALPNTALSADDILAIRNMMKERGYEVNCGLCYVEGSRTNMGQYTKEFLDEYAKTNPKYLPNMAEMNTATGQEKIRIEHPEVYKAYEQYMNKLAQRKPKLYQMATEYQGEILNKFRNAKNISEKNKNGGMRLQSFSDFEIIHLIDCMQVIMDMSRVGLAGQAYTKVPDFAWALGDTGMKINLSLISKGVDSRGNLVLDEVEGMKRSDAEALRNRYPENVGTIVVVFTDRQLAAAMKDPFIDFIIPFHRSQTNKSQYDAMGLPENTKDFTAWQNEAYITPVLNKNGKKQRPANYMPNEYWDFSKSGKENAEAYLKMCAENNRRPKFHYILNENADGSYSLKKDGSTDGYWKLLIDFKMYDNDGKGAPQHPVVPNFNMDEAERMLKEYEGGHSKFPAAKDVVDDFVSQYKSQHTGTRYSLKQFDDGKRFVEVETDQAQFDGLSLNEMNSLATKIIKQKYGNKVVGIDNRTFVNGKSADEYVYYKRGTPKEVIEAKARASTELDNLIDAGTNFRTAEDGADGHVHPDVVDGFSYFDTIFKVGPEYYKGVINIKNIEKGKLFWGVTKTENITQDIGASYGKNPTSTFLRDVSMETVTQEKESVKGKKSKEEIGSGSKSSLKAGTVSNTLAAMQEENDLLKEQVKDYRALQKRIAQLEESRDYWKGQTQRTQTVTTDKKAVAKAAKDLVKNYSATTAISEVQQRLQSLYDYIAAGGEDFSYQYARKQAEALAADLVNSAVETDSELYDEYKELRQYLKTTPIRMGTDVQSEVAYYNELRKANMGRLKLTGGQGTNIDQVYQQLAEQWPEFFDEGVQSNPGDQLQRISDVLSDIYHVEERNPHSQYMAEATAGAANEILETFFDLPQTKATFADRQAKKLQETKAKGQLQLAALREQNRQRMEELRQQNRERVQAVIEKERDKRNEQLQKLKDRYAEKDAGRRERQRAKELRAKITKHANALSRKLLSPNDKQHIPENLRGPVAALLSSLNQESKRSDQRTEAFRALRDRYASILADGGDMVIDPSLLGTKADGFTASFDAVIDMGSIPLEDMSVEQLNTVWQVVKAVEHSVSTAGKILSKAKYDSTQDWAQAISIGSSTRKNRNAWRKNRLSLDLETPYTFFAHFGEAGNAIYRMLRDAQDQQVLLKRQVSEAVQDIVDPKTVRALQRETHEFTTERGEKVTLSTAHLMELYELSKREQAHDHLLKGGIVQPEIEGTKIKRGTDSILLSENDLGAMIGTLDREQLEIADRLQRLTTGLLADMGNKASMQAYGYKKFTGKDYWPIKSAKEGLHYSIEKNGENSRSIKNIGMAKSVMPGANNALELQGVFHTFANHAADMIDYAAWLCPMEDVNRVYNFEFRDMEGNRTGKTVKGVLEAVGGPGSQKYWQTLMDNIQNGINSRSDSPMWDAVGKLVGTFKGAKVAANIRVILQQPTAFFRAAAVLSPKDMTRGLVKGVTNGDGWEKALTYSPIAMRKDDGGFDISAPRTVYESFFDQRSVVRKINDALGEPAGKADAITWGKLWNACEWATKRDHPDLTVGSEAFYRQTARTFAEMIDQTQVVDGVLQRANIMRSKNDVVKQATAFMGEPLMSLNLMMRTWDQYRYEQNNEKRIKAMKAMGRAGVALLVTNVVNAFVQSLVDAMRDDDPDKKYWERLKTAFTGQTGDEENIWEKLKNFTLNGNVGQNLNMAGNIPIAKDILSLIQGYDVSRTEYETIGSFIQAGQTVIASINGSGGRTVSSALADLFATAAEFFGLPAKNIKRDVFGLIHSFANEMDNVPLQYEMAKVTYKLGDKNKGRFYDIMYRALELGDLDTFNHIREELMENSEVNGKDIDSAMKSRYNKAVKNDPNYQLPSTTRSIFGSFDKYQKPAEDEFDEGDLNSTQYKSFSDQRSREFNEMQYHLNNNPIFKGMDAESRSKVLKAAYDLARERALEDNSGGKYESDTEWIQAADEVEDAGIELWEYALFRAEYKMAETERDEKGKVIKGKSTSDKTRDWLEDYDDFTKKQKKVLWGTVYESKW